MFVMGFLHTFTKRFANKCKLSCHAQKYLYNSHVGSQIVFYIQRKGFKMNREELIAEVSKSAKVTKKDASEVLTALIDTIQNTVKKGNKVTLVGFGTWERRQRAARTGRNPQTGATLKIAAKKVPAFSAGKKFKALLSK